MPTSTTTERHVSPWTKRSEAWVLNPGKNIDICFDLGISRFVFTQKTYQFKRNMAIDPKKLIDFAARGRPWRVMLVEYHAKVTLVFDSTVGWSRPVAVYPSWSIRDDTPNALRNLCRNYPKPGETIGKFWGDSTPYGPVEGQDQVIVVRNAPKDRFDWQTAFSFISDMKRVWGMDFHMHGSKSIARTIGISIDSFDHPITIDWVDGRPRLLLPNGQITPVMDNRSDHWAKLIGENLAQFRRLNDRAELRRFAYRFNLKSFIWAERNQDRLYAFQGRNPDGEVDYESSDEEWAPVLSRYRPRLADVTDKWLCDTCTISNRCPYSRSGAICIVDGTEASKLSEKFRSRKATDIVEALSALLGANAERLEKAMVSEQEIADQTGQFRLSPQVTTLANATFDRGIQMARLLDPNVAAQMAGSRTNIAIQANGAAAIVAAATPQEIMAGVAAKLTEFGIPLAEATQDQVEAILRGDDPVVYRGAIEANTTDS
jgi:hypothetical protein